MKLYISCDFCEEDSRVTIKSTDRSTLEREKGEVVKVLCNNCNHSGEYYINQIFAKRDFLFLIIVLVITFAISGAIFYYMYEYAVESEDIDVFTAVAYVSVIPIIVFTLWNKQEKDSINRFNGYKI